MDITILFKFIIVGLIGIGLVLMFLIFTSMRQNWRIYSFRSENKIWDDWKSQIWGLFFFVFGLSIFILFFLGYILTVHPELLNLGFDLMVFIRGNFSYINLFLIAFFEFGITLPGQSDVLIIGMGIFFAGLAITTFGMGLSVISIKKFTKNIEETKRVDK